MGVWDCLNHHSIPVRILSETSAIYSLYDSNCNRATVIPEITEKSAALIANFGATDSVLLDAIFGKFSPTGKLPFEMPSPMDAVRKKKEDLPYDSVQPLFTFVDGLTYPRVALNNEE
jgi:beta-glucosidase